MADHVYGTGIIRHGTNWSELLDAIDANRPAWHADALCKEDHPGVSWFTELGGDSRRAKAICGDCLVLVECRAYAMANPDLVGIWGATDKQERGELRTIATDAEGCTWCGGAAPRGRGRPGDRPCCGAVPCRRARSRESMARSRAKAG